MENLLAAYDEGEDDDEEGEEEQVTEASINLKRSRAELEGKHDTSPDKSATLAASTKTKKARVSEGAKPVVVLPPPPADLFGGSSSPNETKDTSAHLGRVRSFPHIEGNYPTFVYIPGTLAACSCSPLHSPPTHTACRSAVYITAVDGLMPCADRLLQLFRDWYLVSVVVVSGGPILMCAGCPADRSTPSASCGMKAAATSRAAAGRWS